MGLLSHPIPSPAMGDPVPAGCPRHVRTRMGGKLWSPAVTHGTANDLQPGRHHSPEQLGEEFNTWPSAPDPGRRGGCSPERSLRHPAIACPTAIAKMAR